MNTHPPFELVFQMSVASTMEAARSHATSRDAQIPFWFLASTQTMGRGRRGRGWVSPEGNFHGTLAFHPLETMPAHAYGFVLGVALHDVISSLANGIEERLCLKWPNDLLLGAGKLAGILVERHDGLLYAGLGINLLGRPEVSYPTACLADEGISVSASVLARELHHAFFDRLAETQVKGLSHLFGAWSERGPDIGSPCRVSRDDNILSGTYAGVDNTGRLLLKTDGGLITVSTGDTSF